MTSSPSCSNVVASCGHALADQEGPGGLGWPLALKAVSREGEPAVRHGVYCGACRDVALAKPDQVLADEAAQAAWLASGTEPAPTEPGDPPASYGVWSVWDGDPRDPEYTARPVGVYRGFVDAIALAVAWSDRDVAYFRREPDAAAATELAAPGEGEELPECVGLNVIVGNGLLADEHAAIEPFFAGRPVFVRHTSWGNCVALFPASGEAGARYLRERAALRAVLAKLSPEDVALLEQHGLRQS